MNSVHFHFGVHVRATDSGGSFCWLRVCRAWTTAAALEEKKKIETFNQKEQRKRNLGQASREKNFVEGVLPV
jgi:hypothetical protein